MANTTAAFTVEKGFPCEECNRVFYVNKNLLKHMVVHTKSTLKCTYCSKSIHRRIYLQFHERTCEKNPCLSSSSSAGAGGGGISAAAASIPTDGFRFYRSSFQRTVCEYRKVFARNTFCWGEITRALDTLKPILEKEVVEKRCIKWCVCLKVVFMKAVDENVVTDPPAYFQTEMFRGFRATNFECDIQNSATTLEHQVDEFVERGSGWVIKHFVDIVAKVFEYCPLSSYALSDTDDDDADHELVFPDP